MQKEGQVKYPSLAAFKASDAKRAISWKLFHRDLGPEIVEAWLAPRSREVMLRFESGEVRIISRARHALDLESNQGLRLDEQVQCLARRVEIALPREHVDLADTVALEIVQRLRRLSPYLFVIHRFV